MQERVKIKSTEYPFGFNSEKDFLARVQDYKREIQKDLSTADSDDLSTLSPSNRETIVSVIQHRRDELTELERRLKKPIKLYKHVKEIYDKMIIHASQGLSWGEIGAKFVDTDADILPIFGLLEHGIGQNWGYHLAQNYLAAHESSNIDE